MGGRKVGFMTNFRRSARRFPEGASRLFLAGLMICAAGAQAQDKLSLRLSPELTLPSAVAPSQVAVLQPEAAVPPAVPAAALTGQSSLSPRDYRIGTDDLLDIQVFGVDQLTRSVRVNGRGMISLPLIGTLEV